MLLDSLSYIFIVGSNAGYTTFRGRMEEYWLPTPFACFPFTPPPMRHRMPSDFNWTLPHQLKFHFFTTSYQFMIIKALVYTYRIITGLKLTTSSIIPHRLKNFNSQDFKHYPFLTCVYIIK